MPDQHDLPGGSNDPTRANDPVDPTRAQVPIDPTRVQPVVDPTRAQDTTWARPAATAAGAPLVDEPLRRRPDGDDDRDRTGAGWLWALLAAVLIGIVLFALLSQGDDDDDAVGTDDQTEEGAVDTTVADTAPEDTTADTAPEDTEAPEDSAPTDTTATTAPATGGDAPSSAGEDPGTITAAGDGTDLFPLLQGDAGDAERLAPYADQDVVGEGVSVLEIVAGEGFWIGADESRRIFAHADAGAEVAVGQRIDFDGFLKANPADDSADVHDIPEDQGAELHRQQGHHIELRSFTAV